MARIRSHTHIGRARRVSLTTDGYTPYWGAPDLTPDPAPSPHEQAEHQGRVPQVGVPSGPRQTVAPSPSAPAGTPDVYSPSSPRHSSVLAPLVDLFGAGRSTKNGLVDVGGSPLDAIKGLLGDIYRAPAETQKNVIGNQSVKEILAEGHLKPIGDDHLTTPAVRTALGAVGDARRYYRKTALPNLSGLSPAERAVFPYVRQAHKEYPDIPISVGYAQIKQESGFNPLAVSSAGAQGLTQFIPGTAAEYGVEYGNSRHAQQSQVSGQYHYLHSLGFGQDPQAALSAYSGGYAAGDYNNPILEDAKASYSALDQPGRPTRKAAQQFQRASELAKTLGLHPGGPMQPSGPEAVLASQQVPYHAFHKNVARMLHRVVNSPGYKNDSSTTPLTIQGPHGGTLIRDVQGSSGVASVIDKGQGPEIAARLLLLSRKTGLPIHIVSGSRTDAQSAAVGGSAGDPHSEGKAFDIGVNGATIESANQIPESVYESVGLHRPYGTAHGGSSAEDNHVELLNGGTPATGGSTGVGGSVPLGSGGGVATSVAAAGGSAAEAAQAAAAANQRAPVALEALASPFGAGPLGTAAAAPATTPAEELALLLASPALASRGASRRSLVS